MFLPEFLEEATQLNNCLGTFFSVFELCLRLCDRRVHLIFWTSCSWGQSYMLPSRKQICTPRLVSGSSRGREVLGRSLRTGPAISREKGGSCAWDSLKEENLQLNREV